MRGRFQQLDNGLDMSCGIVSRLAGVIVLMLAGCGRAHDIDIADKPKIERKLTQDEVRGLSPELAELWHCILDGTALGKNQSQFESALQLAN
jgi:hypothetical protein